MKVKRIVAANMQEALREVTEQLGAEAAIISTKKVAEGMEVVAALNYQSQKELSQADITRQLNQQALQEQQEQLQAQKKQKEQAKAQSNKELEAWLNKVKQSTALEQGAQPVVAQSRKKVEALPIHNEQPQATPSDKPIEPIAPAVAEPNASSEAYKEMLAQMSGEMQELKKYMLSQQSYRLDSDVWSEQTPISWQQSQLIMRCRDVGIETQWAEQLVSNTNDASPLEEAWKAILANMEKDIPIAHSRLLIEGGCYAFVGPTGAGKTTTIGKLAAQFAMRHGSDSIALITLDQYRVAAHEQLKAFARIMGVHLSITNNLDALQAAIAEQSDKKLILIDTAGLSPQNSHFSQQLSMLSNVKETLKTLLVLPLTSQARCLQENYEYYKKLGLNGCVLTKLDECFSLGAALSVSALAELPVTFVTDGPHIPDDVHQPEANKLLQLALQMAKMSRTRWQVGRTKKTGRDSISA